MRQADRHASTGSATDTATVMRKLLAADGVPGVLDELFGVPCHLFDAHAEYGWPPAGRWLNPARGGPAPARRAARHRDDGAVWIGHVRRADQADAFKLPVGHAFAQQVAALPAWDLPLDAPPAAGWREIRYEAHGPVGVLHFAFYNGAMGTPQCERLNEALRWALAQPTRVLLLMGGPDFWSNGIHLNLIEAAESPADESWRNINAIDDVTLTLIQATGQLVVAALQGNAGAGGVFMALAADQVWARPGVVLNPHYKNMGNLHGSEYWTYLLPRRLGTSPCAAVMDHRLPISASRAAELGLVDKVLAETSRGFAQEAQQRALALAADPALPERLQAKQARRQADEAQRPLVDYRTDELRRMHRNFYGFDPSYHIARSNFVRRVPPSWTPRHLAVHRHSQGPGHTTPGAEIDSHQGS
jgi:putative two-component system hydrogenase maturation factor HypX/HoxX